MSDDLLPCPFCGTHLVERGGGMFHADELTGDDNDCVLAGLSWRVSHYRSKWNTRALTKVEDDE